jgi:alkylated DNA repair protein (DNA oxidative demethylase)
VISQAPFRHMVTSRGHSMQVAMTNCGALGWTSSKSGYRYTDHDPYTGAIWPKMPACFAQLASDAANEVGYHSFMPDACLINRYAPGSRLSLHQDRNERDFSHPIVSVSLGVPAVFHFGGHKRADRPQRVQLAHGDIVVWGGNSRLRYHGIAPLKHSWHQFAGNCRINLTFRKAGPA